uniref:USP domain-containing protein n=1 Tax=Macrostomum lignano TaxID=282301 RepID=A0A1I8JL27_9PLAT
MAENLKNYNKSLDTGPVHYEFYINQYPLTFYPNGVGMDTKIGLLWRNCSENTFHQFGGRIPRGLATSCELFVCLDYPATVAACQPSVDMKRLTAAQKELLSPVLHSERLLCIEKGLLQVGQRCQVGDCVLAVDPLKHDLREPTKFTVRYKGSLRERRDKGTPYAGTYFGLVSTEPVKNFGPRQVSCFKDIYSPDVLQYAIKERNEGDHQAVLCSLNWIVGLVDKKFALKSGDQVLWFDDERPTPLRGVVVRIVNDKLASVNFDMDGKKKSIDVPIEALMLASDYEVDSAERPRSPYPFDSQSDASAAAAAAAAADPHAAASGHRRQGSDYDNAPPPPYESVDPLALATEHGLELNAAVLVEEPRNHQPQQGFLRWCGSFHNEAIAGVDCEMTPFDSVSASAIRRACPDAPTDSSISFVQLNRVRLDPRFRETRSPAPDLTPSQRFGHKTCEIVDGDCKPVAHEHWGKLVGPSRGIQGHHNSCYLDATLFAMFTTVSVFDGVLNRKRNKKKDIPEYEEIQKCLKLNIVNCLREHQFVRADHVIKLREQLDKLGKVPGMLGEEKDPEEFINLLLDHALKHDPYIKLSSNQACHVLQLFVDSSQYDLKLPDTETLLHLTLLQAGLKLTQTPSCLVLQTPRSGKDYKLFDRVVPSTELDISNLLTEHPRQCCVCGKLAELECHDCFLQFQEASKDYTFCKKCFDNNKDHKNPKAQHKTVGIKYPKQVTKKYGKDKPVECPVKMKLFAVVCIHTSHYVCFLRLCQPDNRPAKWLFFDSMADRS